MPRVGVLHSGDRDQRRSACVVPGGRRGRPDPDKVGRGRSAVSRGHGDELRCRVSGRGIELLVLKMPGGSEANLPQSRSALFGEGQ